jgi:hypothetical protein
MFCLLHCILQANEQSQPALSIMHLHLLMHSQYVKGLMAQLAHYSHGTCLQERPSSRAAAAAVAAELKATEQHIAALQPFWKQLTHKQQLELLTVGLPELRQQVAEMAAEELANISTGGNML